MRDPTTDGKLALESLISRGLGEAVSITSVAPLSGGASSATYRVDATVGPDGRPFIFQRTAGETTNSISRTVQSEVQERAGRLGVPVPQVIARTTPSDDLGDGVVTALVEGEALAPRLSLIHI